MIVCGVPLDGATTQELKLIQAEIGKEIEKRERAAMEGEWNMVRQAIRSWTEKHGHILCIDSDDLIFSELRMKDLENIGEIHFS